MRMLMKMLPLLQKRKVQPCVVTVVDNFPAKNQKDTNVFSDDDSRLAYYIYNSILQNRIVNVSISMFLYMYIC